MSKLDPVDSNNRPPAPEHHSRGGGGFLTFLIAAAALAVGLYLVYERTGFSSDRLNRLVDEIPSASELTKPSEGDNEIEHALVDNVGALEERLAKLEEASSRMESIIEQIGREVGRIQGVSEQTSSIPLYLLRINLADMRLRLTGSPQLVLQELREVLTFIPEEQSNLRASLQAEIGRLEGTPSKEDLTRTLDELAEALEGPLIQNQEDLPREGVLGAFFELVDARHAAPPELEYLENARAAAREARTLALIGDERNYLLRLEAIEKNVVRFRDKYDPSLLGDIESALDSLLEDGLPDYSLAAAKPI